MTITAEAFAQLAKTFTPPSAEQSGVDLLKVASKLATDTSATFSDADPMSKLGDLVKSVDVVESLLAKAVEDKDGNVFISGAVAEEFAVDKALPPEFLGNKKPKKGDEKKDKKDGAKKTDSTAKGEGDDGTEGDKTGTTKGDLDLSDDVSWEQDLAPRRPPTRRSERMTKGQRPILARKGARDRVQKYEDSRDRAMERAADLKTGNTDRTTT